MRGCPPPTPPLLLLPPNCDAVLTVLLALGRRCCRCHRLFLPFRPDAGFRHFRLSSLSVPHPLCFSFQYLYTLKVTDVEKANKLENSLPPGLTRKDI